MNSLYPSFPGPSIDENQHPLFETFMNRIAPLYNQSHGSMQQSQGQGTSPGGMPNLTPEMSNAIGDGRPGNLTKMNVIYQPSIGDIGRERSYSQNVFNEDLDPNSQYRQGQLALRERELNQRGEKIAADSALANKKFGLSQKQVEINDYKAKNPGILISAPKGGRISAINKLTGAHVADLGDTGTMSEEERVAADQTNELARIGAKGEQSKELETQRQTGRETLEEQTARHAMERKQLETGTESKSAHIPSQERTATLSRAEQARNTHPEWSKYIKVTPGQGFVITTPGASILGQQISGPTPEEYKKINDFIYNSPTTNRRTTTEKADPLGIR